MDVYPFSRQRWITLVDRLRFLGLKERMNNMMIRRTLYGQTSLFEYAALFPSCRLFLRYGCRLSSTRIWYSVLSQQINNYTNTQAICR